MCIIDAKIISRGSCTLELLLSQLKNVTSKLNTILACIVGQGYIPLAVMKQYEPQKIFLVDRDLQALHISQENLLTKGYVTDAIEVCHQVGLTLDRIIVDAIIGVLPKKQEVAVYSFFIDQAYTLLNTKRYFLFSASFTVITRITAIATKGARFEIIKRVKNKGKSVIMLRKK